MKDLIENLLDTILHDCLISRTVDRLLSGAPKGLRKYGKEISKFLYADVVGVVQRIL